MGKDLFVISEENIVATPESILGQGYEFFIPILFVPKLINVKIDSTTIQPTPGSLIPANPGRTHGFDGELTIYN